MFKESTMLQKETEKDLQKKEYLLPPMFSQIRDLISIHLKRPISQRFSPEEYDATMKLSGRNLEKEIADFKKTNGREPTGEEIAEVQTEYEKRRVSAFQKRLAQVELHHILNDIGLFEENKHGEDGGVEKMEKTHECKDETCLLEPDTHGVMRPWNDGAATEPNKKGGDTFFRQTAVRGQKEYIDLTLIDAEGHGTKGIPGAALSAKFIKEAQRANVPYDQIITKLDEYLESLSLHRKTISFMHATLRTDHGKKEKQLSVIDVGTPGILFWIEGDRKKGFTVPCIGIAEKEGESDDVLQPIALPDESAFSAAGEGIIELQSRGRILAKELPVPYDADIYFSSDGLFDRENEKGEKLLDNLGSILSAFFEKHRGKDREELEELLYEEILSEAEKYKQEDDETFFKIRG